MADVLDDDDIPPHVRRILDQQAREKAKVDHAVGFRKPPKANRFKPGQSGNPKGRPPKNRHMQNLIEASMIKRTDVTIGGKRKRMSQAELAILRLERQAATGDMRANDKLILLYQQVSPVLPIPDIDPEEEQRKAQLVTKMVGILNMGASLKKRYGSSWLRQLEQKDGGEGGNGDSEA